MEKDAKVFVAGHRGLVGAAIIKKLKERGFANIITRTHGELDLVNQHATTSFFSEVKPDYVFLAAARVGGILANNTYRGEFIYQNLMIQNNVLHESWRSGVKKLLFLGSSCIYPKFCPQPMQEEHLMTGPLEPTNSPYAVAKIAGIEMCWAYNSQYSSRFIPVMPTNLYGTNDNFDLEKSHVLPALIRKFHLAKLAAAGDVAGLERDQARFGGIPQDIREAIGLSEDGRSIMRNHPRVLLWGSGAPMREMLHVDDMADGCVHLMELPDAAFATQGMDFSSILFNIGSGRELSIRELAEQTQNIVGFDGEVVFDPSKPDGAPRKLLDISRMAKLGWRAKITIEEGLADVYRWYVGETTN